ncbi:hypothetical protein BC829DRAFT_388374, partial [Chytridium lagenaria]
MIPVPHLSYSTVEQILAINTHIIKILIEYQNNGWFEEPEFKIYQQRLQTNLTYLATAADYLGKTGKPLANLSPIPDLSPNVMDAQAAKYGTSDQHNLGQQSVDAFGKPWMGSNLNTQDNGAGNGQNLNQSSNLDWTRLGGNQIGSTNMQGNSPETTQPGMPAYTMGQQHHMVADENPGDLEPNDYNPVPPFVMPQHIPQDLLPPHASFD